MAKNRPILKPRYDQYLVADQPGKKIFFIGLILPVVVGLIFRGLISSQNIQPLVAHAASRIHSDMVVEFSSAEVSLSHRGIPRFAVVVNQVIMASQNPCWGRPVFKAKQLVLPLSVWDLLFSAQPFKSIQAVQADLRLRSKISSCEDKPVAKKIGPQEQTQTITLATPPPEIKSGETVPIEKIEIDFLRIRPDPSGQNPIEVVDLVLKLASRDPKKVILDAQTHLAKDPLFQNYVSLGRVHAEYKEFPEKNLVLQFFGNLREGNYSLNAAYDFSDGNFSSNVDLKHIPAAQVVNVLKDYGWLQEDYDGRKIWVTMKGQSQGSLKNWEKLPLIISDFRLEGDVGEITIDYFEAYQLKPFIFKPLKAVVKNLDVDRLLEVIKRPRQLKFIRSLGRFNGTLDLRHEDEVKLSGEHSGVEFIFSNGSFREIQTISSIKGDFSMRQNRWNLNIRDLVLNDGKFKGQMRLAADRDFRDIEVTLGAQELSFSPAVQKVISEGGEIPTVKGDLKTHIQNGQILQLSGFFSIPQLVANKIQFEKFSTDFDSRSGYGHFSVKAQRVNVRPNSSVYPFLKKILKEDDINSDFKFKDFSVRFQTTPLDELKWTQLSLSSLGNEHRISSDGGWNQQGFLNGEMLSRGKSKSTWYFSGHRDHPEVTESSGNKSKGP